MGGTGLEPVTPCVSCRPVAFRCIRPSSKALRFQAFRSGPFASVLLDSDYLLKYLLKYLLTLSVITSRKGSTMTFQQLLTRTLVSLHGRALLYVQLAPSTWAIAPGKVGSYGKQPPRSIIGSRLNEWTTILDSALNLPLLAIAQWQFGNCGFRSK